MDKNPTKSYFFNLIIKILKNYSKNKVKNFRTQIINEIKGVKIENIIINGGGTG